MREVSVCIINVNHVYSKVASKVLEDVHSKSNTHMVLEFKCIRRFLVEMVNLREVWLTKKFVVKLDEWW